MMIRVYSLAALVFTAVPSRARAQDPLAEARARCDFEAGASVIDTLGVTPDDRSAIPIDTIVVLMQENRAFDHYFGRMPQTGRTDVDGIPDGYTNPDGRGGAVTPAHATTTCISPDTPHSWNGSHRAWNQGAMDGFFVEAGGVQNNGARAISWYDETDLPFYYWLYSTYAMSDRFFCSVLGPTWPNRDYLYAATSDGVIANDRPIAVRTIFDALDDAGISWGIYVDGTPRQNCIGYSRAHRGVFTTAAFIAQLADGSLPSVAFIDGSGAGRDEHPPADIQSAEGWVRGLYVAATESPLWSRMAFFVTYDEGGGFFDHVPPPSACPASPSEAASFSQLGVRVPVALISPYARPGYVSHVVHSAPSITRFIELMYDLPALTARDANSDAMLDLFDFSSPQLLLPPSPPAAGTGGCR